MYEEEEEIIHDGGNGGENQESSNSGFWTDNEGNEIPKGKIPLYNASGEIYDYIDDKNGDEDLPDDENNGQKFNQQKPKENETEKRAFLKNLTEKFGLNMPEISDEDLEEYTPEELEKELQGVFYENKMKETDPEAYIFKTVGKEKFKEVFENYEHQKEHSKRLLAYSDSDLGKNNLINFIIDSNKNLFEKDEKGFFTPESQQLMNTLFNQQLKTYAKQYNKTEQQILEEMGKNSRQQIQQYNPLDTVLQEYEKAQKTLQENNYKTYEEQMIPMLTSKVSLKKELDNMGFSDFEITENMEKELKSFIADNLSIRKDAKSTEAEVKFFHKLHTNPELLTKLIALNFMVDKGFFSKASQSTKTKMFKNFFK